MIAFVATDAIGSVLSATIIFLLFRIKSALNLSIDWPMLRRLGRDASPMVLIGIVYALQLRIDQVMINKMLGPEALGLYAAALKPQDMLQIVPGIIGATVVPSLVRSRKDGQAAFDVRLKLLYSVMAVCAWPLATGIFVFAPLIINLIYGSKYSEAADVLQIRIWAVLIMFVDMGRAQWSLAENQQRIQVGLLSVGLMIKVALNFALLPVLGLEGAAMATLITVVCYALICPMFINAGQRQQAKSMIRALAAAGCPIDGPAAAARNPFSGVNPQEKNMAQKEKFERVESIYGPLMSWSDDLITSQLRQFGAHTRNELAMLASLIRPGDNILDIGAHIGTFALAFARFNGGRGRIFSFEANTDNFQLLSTNIRLNQLDSVITPVFGVVSATSGRFSMHSPAKDNTGMHYFLPAEKDSDSALPTVNIDEWHGAQGEPAVALVKIDVEGAEVSALQSCRRLLQKSRPAVYVEINQSALMKFGCSAESVQRELRELGYHFFRNVGERNSENDRFNIARLPTLTKGGDFFDCLAIHPASPRYPRGFRPSAVYRLWRARKLARKALRYLRVRGDN